MKKGIIILRYGTMFPSHIWQREKVAFVSQYEWEPEDHTQEDFEYAQEASRKTFEKHKIFFLENPL